MSTKGFDPMKSRTTLICAYCGYKFRNKEFLTNHIKIHMETPKSYGFFCNLCKLEFKNKGLLACHVSKKHTNKFTEKSSPSDNSTYKYKCVACQRHFHYNYQLKYHVRKTHFNLLSKVPYCNIKSVNEKWFEKVFNKNIYVEIQKIETNIVLIRKVGGTSIQALDIPRDLIDLRLMYNSDNTKRMLCPLCSKLCLSKELGQHVAENHSGLLKQKCDDCNCMYVRLSDSLRHECPA